MPDTAGNFTGTTVFASQHQEGKQAVASLGRKVMFGVSHFPGSTELGGVNEKLNSFDRIP